jgi:threonylcarbamoyladenosine tRNA methylthiotransferase MtaB
MRASLHTVGCRLNQAETAVLAGRLKQQGYELVEYGRPTDLLVLNTCSVTDHAEKDCRYEIRRTLRHSPGAFVAVTGCYAQTGANVLRHIPGVDLIVGAQYKMDLPAYLPRPHSLRKRPTPELLHTRAIGRDDFAMEGTGEYDSTRANLKIQDGCSFMCSFCIIPFARGHERSRRFDDIVREADALAAKGHRELVLTGVNLGQYSHQGRSIVDLIRRLESVAVDRIRISSIEPTTVHDDLLECMAASGKLCRYLHIPLQSGDDGILKRMNRRYTVKDYAALIDRAMKLMPDLGLGTDLMVGFPGEGDAEFGGTEAIARDIPFAYFHVFSYSPRPGTAAAHFDDSVPSAVVRARSLALATLSRAKRLAFYQRYTGRPVQVLFEGTDDAGRWTGHTDNYLRVGVVSGEDLRNRIRTAVVTGTMDGLAVGHLSA